MNPACVVMLPMPQAAAKSAPFCSARTRLVPVPARAAPRLWHARTGLAALLPRQVLRGAHAALHRESALHAPLSSD